jgi:23S rRNA (uracil1939-C5)-methyltransferase
MARRRDPQVPFETEIERLDARGRGLGQTPNGRAVAIRGAPPGARVLARITGRQSGVLLGRRDALIRPAPDAAEPRCAKFGLCGGCTLQDLAPAAQRAARHEAALRAVIGEAPAGHGGPAVHPPVHTDDVWGYRNRVELSFGPRRYLAQADLDAGEAIGGRFLGFHAPERFDRLVDVARCEIAPEPFMPLIDVVRRHALADDAPAPWDNRTHEGFWRYLLLRHGAATGEVLVCLFTADQPEHAHHVARLAEALRATPLPVARVVGVEWVTSDAKADIAQGETRQVWGAAELHEELAGARFRIGRRTFFQTHTAGAERLVATVASALPPGGTLLDLYCGTGTFSLTLGHRYARVLGVEEVAEAIADARHNAEANGLTATFEVSKVEDALARLDAVEGGGPLHILVDPPRAGLHPKVAAWLGRTRADTLVYVACHAASLGRDRLALEAAGWTLTDVWTVDLFPHTGHIEVVGRFVRPT